MNAFDNILQDRITVDPKRPRRIQEKLAALRKAIVLQSDRDTVLALHQDLKAEIQSYRLAVRKYELVHQMMTQEIQGFAAEKRRLDCLMHETSEAITGAKAQLIEAQRGEAQQRIYDERVTHIEKNDSRQALQSQLDDLEQRKQVLRQRQAQASDDAVSRTVHLEAVQASIAQYTQHVQALLAQRRGGTASSGRRGQLAGDARDMAVDGEGGAGAGAAGAGAAPSPALSYQTGPGTPVPSAAAAPGTPLRHDAGSGRHPPPTAPTALSYRGRGSLAAATAEDVAMEEGEADEE
ncbi:hypothetical protein CXG81DRAFT_23976 [Caulochytrium protostelioides]|uniref:Uncharacterized protein n=1 Tax=Caulochytrium protostelioides TaxID=1555241 RepID=A0A4P9XDC6_9FUNG|nr:hypothetical protein CXG81DRAFT_23976 [Caulochytrium protostelioides]|eukprot:RKP03452.1 hypothetical protein CXG81DRAFT_23976 [Caulochytrium protostelioides]